MTSFRSSLYVTLRKELYMYMGAGIRNTKANFFAQKRSMQIKIHGGLFYMCKLSRRYTVHTISLIIGAIQDFYEERAPNDVFTMVSS
jgi:hypothetical protein